MRTSGRDLNPQNSIYNQILLLEQYYNANFKGCEYVIYQDNGYTGTNINRPAFNSMIQDIKDGKINCVFVKDLSRFSRNYVQIGYFLEILMPVFKTRFIAINDFYDSNKLSDGLNIDLALKNIINSYYSKDISKKITSSIQERKKNGKFICSFFGYKKASPTSSYLLDVNEEQANIVRRIFNLFVIERKTISEIALILNNENVPTPKHFRRVTKDNPTHLWMWDYTNIHKILKNEKYTGKYTCYIPYNGKMTWEKRASDDLHEKRIYYDKYEPIIDLKLFNDATKLFKNNSVSQKGKPRPEITNPFVGKLKCGICGYALGRVSRTSQFSYKCAKSSLSKNDNKHTVRITKDELVDVLQSVFDKYKELYITQNKQKNIDKSKSNGLSEQDKYELYKDYINGVYTKNEYLAKLRNNICTTSATSDIVSDKLSKDISVNDDVLGFMNEFVQQIEVYPNKKINIQWDFSIELNYNKLPSKTKNANYKKDVFLY